MKIFKFLFGITLGLFFLPRVVVSQELKIINGDTVILITPDHLTKINTIITEREFVLKELDLMYKIVDNSENTIEHKDSIIEYNSVILAKNVEMYEHQIEDINIKLQAEEKKSKWLSWGLAGATGGIITLLLIK